MCDLNPLFMYGAIICTCVFGVVIFRLRGVHVCVVDAHVCACPHSHISLIHKLESMSMCVFNTRAYVYACGRELGILNMCACVFFFNARVCVYVCDRLKLPSRAK